MVAALAVTASLAACAPEYNWREIRPDAQGFTVMLPAKPATMSRGISLGGMPVEMTMHGAKVGDTSFTVGMVVLPDAEAGRGAAAVAAMREGMMRNIAGREVAVREVRTPLVDAGGQQRGSVPATEVELEGRMHEAPARMLARYTSVADRAYQWVVLGPEIDREQAATFLDSMRIRVPAAAPR